MSDLIRFERATFTRAGGGDVLFRDLTWTLRDGETWAVVGPVGSGKTTFAQVLLGRHPLRSGTAAWPIVGRAAFPSDVIRVVAFQEDSRLFSYRGHYYQERFNFTDPLDDVTVGEYLRSGMSADAEVERVAERLGVGGLLGASFLTLSNGQVRRTRIARSLLAKPELLVLDDPFMGLDAAGRNDVAQLLGELVTQGTRVLLIARPEFVPAWVTRVLELDGLQVVGVASRDRKGAAFPPNRRSFAVAARHAGEPVLELRNVTVRYGEKRILEAISWQVHRGERWALLGPNGSGKTTLLSLICGDHPQAYANEVFVFGQRRGTGESIWDVKRRIGLVSPELHLYFTTPMNAETAAATGFFDVVTPRATTLEQNAIVHQLFAEFGLTDVIGRPFARLSTGQQRLVLLVRALVKSPELLILDEPFQGLDRAAIDHAKAWLDANLLADQTLIFVSHLADEIPASVTHELRLDLGRVVTSPRSSGE